MISARTGALPLLPLLLISQPPALPTKQDIDGNTALHHASAAGELKALRVLLHYGASPLAQNNYSWTPIAYSATAAAEVYFKQLVAEFEKRRAEGLKLEREREREKERQRTGGVRLVTQDESGGPLRVGTSLDQVRSREDGLGKLPAPGLDWSPIERRAMTPTEGRSAAGWSFGGRGRASSGD
jgi:hypothetical protein